MFDGGDVATAYAYEAYEISPVEIEDEDLDVRQYYGPDGFIHRPTINGLETACGHFSTTHLVWRHAAYDGEPCRDCYSIYEIAKFVEFNARKHKARDTGEIYIGLATGPTRAPMPKMTNPDGALPDADRKKEK